MTFIFLAACFLAYSNGANDNFKGVASLFGSRRTSYIRAISWATVTTAAGSIAAMFFAHSLLKRFSGAGLVPATLATSPYFILSVAIAAGTTVILASLFGFPISTTHGLTGAFVGAGLVGTGIHQVNFTILGKAFIVPLLLSPFLAILLGAALYSVLHFARQRLGVTTETCTCIGAEPELVLSQTPGLSSLSSSSTISIAVSSQTECVQRYSGAFLGLSVGDLIDALHFLSAGLVSFARGLNDTPKMVALLLVAGTVQPHLAFAAITASIAIGGLVNAKKVAETMSNKLTDMNSGQAFSANVSTAILVAAASLGGLPVSTTHVSVGSLVGMGMVTGQTKWKSVFGVAAAWVITLPCAAVLAGIAYVLITLHSK